MKKVAFVGFGFMGRMHYGCWKRLGGAKVAALCDSNLAQLKRASGGKVVTSTVSWAPTGEFGFEAGFRVVFERAYWQARHHPRTWCAGNARMPGGKKV